MLRKISLERSFTRFDDTFSPKIVAEVNGQHMKVVKLEGDKVPWHIHDAEDELFLVIDGRLEVVQRAAEGEERVILENGELCVVKKGIEHRVIPSGRVRLVLFEPAGIAHTGSVDSEITIDSYDWIDFDD